MVNLTFAVRIIFIWKLKLSQPKCFTGNFSNYLDSLSIFIKKRVLLPVFPEQIFEKVGTAASEFIYVKP